MEAGMKNWFKSRILSYSSMLEDSILSDKDLKCKVVYGPVFSRRLGNVLGINNAKQKVCSYNCIYCASGETTCCSVCTNNCLSPYELYTSVKKKLEELNEAGKEIDYIVFSGSGESSLDSGLAKEILLLREFGYKIAVLTNSSMLWNDNIQESLMFADYVSIKVDTVNEDTWLKINRPHKRLDYNLILDGIKTFTSKFNGNVTTETMLVKGMNDSVKEIEDTAEFLNSLKHDASYFSVPYYPVAEECAVCPTDETLKVLSASIKEKVKKSVLLCCPESEEFFATGDFENELVGLLSVHPVRTEAVKQFINGNGEGKILSRLIENGIIKEVSRGGKEYLILNTKNPVSDS
jgi:wyosine [tRNA(Phe)-imidazoG37] synthetase (radical SAM superfamily)